MTAYHMKGEMKLMEHSYIGNGNAEAVASRLLIEGSMRVWWAGDYSDSARPGKEYSEWLRGTRYENDAEPFQKVYRIA